MKQKGFTLIELLVALAVGVIYQVVWGTSRTNSQVVALADVHYAALRLKKDLVMAQLGEGDFPPPPNDTTVITLTPGGPTATLGWTDYTSFEEEENKEHTSSYELLGNGELQRIYDQGEPSQTTSIVGRNITYLDFTQDGRVINVVITATKGDFTPRSETLEFSVYLRTLGIE
ncbi:hypothetical protein ES703_83408 [subsurface metagenome]